MANSIFQTLPLFGCFRINNGLFAVGIVVVLGIVSFGGHRNATKFVSLHILTLDEAKCG